jgi:polyisoprenoid-binding protein YceI
MSSTDDPTTTATTPTSRGRGPLLAVVALLAIGLIGVLVWIRAADEPAAVDLTSTGEADDASMPSDEVDGSDDAVAPEGEDATVAPDGDAAAGFDPDGSWVVDTAAQSFDREAGTGSFVGYRVEEELSSVGAFTAVGRTPAVDGEVTIDDGVVTGAIITGDLRQLESNDGRRDGRVRGIWSDDGLARFELLEPVTIDRVPAEGDVVTFPGRGALTIDGVTREVDVELQATTRGDRLVVGGSTVVVLADFDVAVPSAAIVLSVSDEATIEWQVFLSRT